MILALLLAVAPQPIQMCCCKFRENPVYVRCELPKGRETCAPVFGLPLAEIPWCPGAQPKPPRVA